MDSLLPGQEEAMKAVVGGRNTLAILPTGGGKSAIYQVGGALIPGPTIVVSPLLALQRDQIQSLEEMGLGPAALLNSTLTEREQADVLARVRAGKTEFLLLAPEQVAKEEVVDAIAGAKPSLFVVDEAHCISEWGPDFRPDYLRLGDALDRLGRPRVLALTATAAPAVREEILERLGMRDAEVIVRGFDRPNIRLEVTAAGDARVRDRLLIEAAGAADKPGIVYAPTRRATEQLTRKLADADVAAAAYHAGMADDERERIQDEFMAEAASVDVIVATTAFGMGIDKANVRFVFHAAPTESLDQYHQEIGRAGRDGLPAQAVLFYRAKDLGLRRYFAGRARIDAAHFSEIVEAVRDAAAPIALPAVAKQAKLSAPVARRAIERLAQIGAVELLHEFASAATDDHRSPGDIAAEAVAAEEGLIQYDRSRVEMMRAYAETQECRRGFLLNYFGEMFEGPCGNCDNDDAAAGVQATAESAEAERPFALQSRVRHLLYGTGTVHHYEDGLMTVLFDDEGYRTLDVEHVTSEALLRDA